MRVTLSTTVLFVRRSRSDLAGRLWATRKLLYSDSTPLKLPYFMESYPTIWENNTAVFGL